MHYNNAMQADSIRAVLFDFGGVLVEEGFREGLSDLARQQGLNPQAVHQAAYDAIYESGYVLGRGTEDEFWNLLCRKVGLCGDIEPLRQAIAARFALRPLMLGVVRALRRRGYVTAILSDQTDWLDRMDAELHFFQDFDKVYNSYHLGKGKRDPSIFDDVLFDLGCTPRQAVFVDDDPGNCERARSRGLRVVLFLNEVQCIHDLEAAVGHPILER
ncbi:MAG: HAD family phosphatase [Deltaproteobacteria bacterium]